MKKKNEPGFIPGFIPGFRCLIENTPAQRDSKMSNGRLSGGDCRWQGGRLPENSPARRDSIMSNLAKLLKTTPARRDSGNSILGILRILRILGILGQRHKTKTSLAQRDSKMSNGRLPMVSCLPHGGRLSEDSPAQGDSGISKLGGAMGIMRIMGKGHKNKNSPAQLDSIMSNPGMGLIGLMGPIGLMGKQPVNENSPAQAGSNISKLVLSLCLAGCQASPAMRDVLCLRLFNGTPESLMRKHPIVSQLLFAINETCQQKVNNAELPEIQCSILQRRTSPPGRPLHHACAVILNLQSLPRRR